MGENASGNFWEFLGIPNNSVDRRQFCRCIIGVSGVLRRPYCICKPKMAACALRIKCCVLESCCSFDGSFPSRSTIPSLDCLWNLWELLGIAKTPMRIYGNF